MPNWFGRHKAFGKSKREVDSRKENQSGASDTFMVYRNATSNEMLQRLWLRSLTFCIAFGVVVVLAFGTWFPTASIAVAVLLAGGSLLIGALLGFLFGVPRSAPPSEGKTAKSKDRTEDRTEPAGDAPDPNRYRPNTNLEEVSDWLTKILVGVGLTQLGTAPARAVAFGQYLGPSLGGGQIGERIGGLWNTVSLLALIVESFVLNVGSVLGISCQCIGSNRHSPSINRRTGEFIVGHRL